MPAPNCQTPCREVKAPRRGETPAAPACLLASMAVLMSVLALTLTVPACGPTSPGPGDGGVGSDGSGSGDGSTDAQGADCQSNADCDGGVCVGGHCCPTAEQACGQACCGTEQVCFANACLSPGIVCHSAADCEEGEYCEFGLGGSDGGVPDAGAPSDGGVCLHAAPSGRCVALPPRCDADGGVPDGGTCIPDCEYHPPSGGPLTATMKWRWGPTATEYPDYTDIWATPAVGRVTDTNCDGVVDALDPPNIIFVSGNAMATCCQCTGQSPSKCRDGVLRVLDGLSGQEIWSLRRATSGSMGFAGLSVAIADLDADGSMEIVAATGEGYLVVIDRDGALVAQSDTTVDTNPTNTYGWGGGIAIADMDADGNPEVALGNHVYTFTGASLSQRFAGSAGFGGTASWHTPLSTFADVDEDGDLELVAGRTVYDPDGSILWDVTSIGDGFPAVADMDQDSHPDVVLVVSGDVYILAGATGSVKLGPATLPGSGFGGPPTVADFDGDGRPEIGVAQANFYSVLKPDFGAGTLTILWQTANHDLSSSVTGSTVFDFEGDGAAEVIYNDECFLWVYDGATGAIRFATPTTSFTATESSLVADVDGDGHAEMVMIANAANPSASGWGCDVAPWNQPDPNSVRPAWAPPPGETAWRGLAVFGDTANSWVSTRTLWNQHSYHVTNICDSRDSACDPPNLYGSIPSPERESWLVSWLNSFRQNVQDSGLFDAPDAVVVLVADCLDPVLLHAYVRNLGAAILPAGVQVGLYLHRGGQDTLLATVQTDTPLFPGQTQELTYTTTASDGVSTSDSFLARILTDPQNPTFHECREDNNEAGPTAPDCNVVD